MGMQVGILLMLVYILAVVIGIAFMVSLIVFLFRYLSLKGQTNALLRELVQILKENNQKKE